MFILKSSIRKIIHIIKKYIKIIYFCFFDLITIFRIICIKKIDNKRVFWLITPVHGNIGDQAIAVAEKKVLNQNRVRYFEVSGEQMFRIMKKNMLYIFNGNPIVMHGGGYLGTLWFHDEVLVRNILISNPDSSILFFPNSVYFENDSNGMKEKEKSIAIYNSHKNIKIYARELKSYNILIEMGVPCELAPDSVMLLKDDVLSMKRKGCLMLLRKDCENTRTYDTDCFISEIVNKKFGDDVKWSDTVVPYRIPIKNRNKVLQSFFEEIKGYELVVTDRLHGMVLSAITGTPCIVINSKSHKVYGCYEWIKNLDYIRICDNISLLCQIIDEMPKGQQYYDNRIVNLNYSKMIYDIKKISNYDFVK